MSKKIVFLLIIILFFRFSYGDMTHGVIKKVVKGNQIVVTVQNRDEVFILSFIRTEDLWNKPLKSEAFAKKTLSAIRKYLKPGTLVPKQARIYALC